MPETLLTILKFCFLALLYLFFVRVLRAVWVEVSGRGASTTAALGGDGAGLGGARAARAGAGVGSKAANRLVALEPSSMKGTGFDLADELTLGRASGCQIMLDDTFVSQLHARVFRRDGQVWVEDLGSTNGTHVNGSKITAPVVVRRGDRLQVGQTVLEVTG